MPVRMTAKANTQPLDELEAFFGQFESVAFDVWEDTVSDNRVNILDELQTEPPPAKQPIEWKNRAQQIAVIIAIKEKQGFLPYQRTGQLANAWIVEVERSGGAFLMIIENPSAISKFVYGSLAQNRNLALRFQQPFHRNTGWQAATDTVSFWVDAVFDDYIDRMRNLAIVTGTKRAYTR